MLVFLLIVMLLVMFAVLWFLLCVSDQLEEINFHLIGIYDLILEDKEVLNVGGEKSGYNELSVEDNL